MSDKNQKKTTTPHEWTVERYAAYITALEGYVSKLKDAMEESEDSGNPPPPPPPPPNG